MLRQISISNFKCFTTKETVDLNQLTVFSGKNSSGKSSLYQPLVCLAQQTPNDDVKIGNNYIPVLNTYGNLIKLGSAEELLSDPESPLDIELEYDEANIRFSYSLVEKRLLLSSQRFILYQIELDEDAVTSYSYYYSNLTKRFTIEGSHSFIFDNSYVQHELDSLIYSVLDEYSKSGKELPITNTEFTKGYFYKHDITFEEVDDISFLNNVLLGFSVSWDDIRIIIKDEILDLINPDMLDECIKKLQAATKSKRLRLSISSDYLDLGFPYERLVPVFPFRGTPKRYYDYVQDQDVISAFKYNCPAVIPYDINGDEIVSGSAQEAIRYWLKKIPEINNVRVNDRITDVSAEILIGSGNKEYPLNAVGYGLGQAIPIIIQLLTRHPKALYIIDEPEIHLHPQAQIALALFIETMSKIGRQIIMETHSEYIINKFILDSIKSTNKDIGLFWINKNNESSSVSRIEYDRLGFINNKPEGFSDGMESINNDILDFRMDNL